VAYDGACSPNVSVKWREFPSAPCLAGRRSRRRRRKKKKLDDISRLGVVEIARVA
jgi:hypothetical protein